MNTISIQHTKQRIDRLFLDLKKEIAEYERGLNIIFNTRERVRSVIFESNINVLSVSGIELIASLLDESDRIKEFNNQRIRGIDNITAAIAGYLKLLLDECLAKYTPQLKVWIRMRIQRLSSMREIQVNSFPQFISFPVAVGILVPYIILTKDSSSSSNMVSIRNAIRDLSETSY